jgi:hypothetical protein
LIASVAQGSKEIFFNKMNAAFFTVNATLGLIDTIEKHR